MEKATPIEEQTGSSFHYKEVDLTAERSHYCFLSAVEVERRDKVLFPVVVELEEAYYWQEDAEEVSLVEELLEMREEHIYSVALLVQNIFSVIPRLTVAGSLVTHAERIGLVLDSKLVVVDFVATDHLLEVPHYNSHSWHNEVR